MLDGHPHTLSFLVAVRCVPITCLGVDDFGQSGDVEDLYRHFGIDTETIIDAALDLMRPAMTEIKMPKLSDSMEQGTILSWLQEDGKQISEGDELLEIETDKATMAYESPSGRGPDDRRGESATTLPVGAVIATLGDGAQVSRAPAAQPDPEPVTAPDAPAEPEPEGNGSDPATVRATSGGAPPRAANTASISAICGAPVRSAGSLARM